MRKAMGTAKSWKEFLNGDKKMKLIFAVGIIGILLIFLSSFLPKGKTAAGTGAEQAEKQTSAAQPLLTNEEYEQRYQQRVEKLVRSIDGAGAAHAVVTLESGPEYVYAKEESKTDDLTNGGDTLSKRNSLDQKTILVEDSDGRRTALLRMTLEPTVKGVVVVCEGGGNPMVVEQVTEAVKVALGIPSTRVCVTKLTEAGFADTDIP